MIGKVQSWLETLFATANGPTRRPQLTAHRESNIPGLFIIGDLAGAPVIKLAMAQGFETIEHVSTLPFPKKPDEDTLDILVVGAGASGLNAALAAGESAAALPTASMTTLGVTISSLSAQNLRQ